VSTAAYVALGILVITYALIISERVHRAVAAMVGGVLIVIAGRIIGFFSQEDALLSIDFNTIGLLLGMMILVGVLSETGFFQYVALKAIKLAGGDRVKLLFYLTGVTALVSAFLDNVTTVLLMAPVSISISRHFKMSPYPFLIGEVLASNIGGTATLIGDPPNVMIGSQAGIPFSAFLMHLGPIVVVVYFVSYGFIYLFYREELAVGEPLDVSDIQEEEAIKDPLLLKKCLFVFGLTIALFFIHDMIGVEPSFIALAGATLLLLLTMAHPEKVLHHVEWTTLVFFAGLFVVVGGLEASGLISAMALYLTTVTGGDLLTTMMVVIWVSALFSAVVDNIPFTATMIPLLMFISSHGAIAAQVSSYSVNPLWWALSLGACLGGNGTLVGASANVVVAGVSERMGYPISFLDFTKRGLPVMLLSVAVSSALLYLFTFVFHW